MQLWLLAALHTCIHRRDWYQLLVRNKNQTLVKSQATVFCVEEGLKG